MEKKKIHYAWIIALTCFCIQGGLVGIITNCRGLFFTPICEDLKLGLGSLTFYTTFYGLASLISTPFAARILPKYNIRIVQTIALAVIVTTNVTIAFISKLYQWYILAALQGFAAPYLLLSIPLLINNWFYKEKGTVLGFVSASSGLIGVVMNLVGEKVIESYGWRIGYLFMSAVILVMVLPCVAFLTRYYPREKGVEPYDYRETESVENNISTTGISAERVIKTGSFWFLIAAVALTSILAAYNQMFSGYTVSIGLTSSFGAALVSMAMIGNIGGKLLIGHISDRFGVNIAACIGYLMVSLSFVLLFVTGSKLALLVGAMLSGLTMAVCVVLFPIITLKNYGNFEYNIIYSYISMTGTLFNALGYSFFGMVIENSKNYMPSLLLGLAFSLAAIFFAFCSRRFSKWEEVLVN